MHAGDDRCQVGEGSSISSTRTGTWPEPLQVSQSTAGQARMSRSSGSTPCSAGSPPTGGKGATGVWRSFLTDEYSKTFAKAGGIGIADQVYRSLMAQQEVH